MNREDFDKYIEEIRAFCKTHDIKDHPTEYFAYRRRLVEIANDTSIEIATRIDAYFLQSSIKWVFNCVTGTQIKKRLEQYPESTLYSGHRSLTRDCMTPVAKLATRFEFKPKPIVHDIKHYYAVNHGT